MPQSDTIDPTAIQRALDLLATGGLVLHVIAALSVLALAIVLLKLAQFVALRVWSHGFVAQMSAAWRTGEVRRALGLVAAARGPVARAMEFAARETLKGGTQDAAREEKVARHSAALLADLQGYLRTLALIATLSPLLGLLGTVIGMIDAFQALEEAGSRVDPSVLSGGIWQALLTTAAGLSVAIPATAAHHWLEGVIDRVAAAMEDAVNAVLEPPGSGPAAGPVGTKAVPAGPAAAPA